jgi:uncharacterized hydantoinase/oxoprolinase family protein
MYLKKSSVKQTSEKMFAGKNNKEELKNITVKGLSDLLLQNACKSFTPISEKL